MDQKLIYYYSLFKLSEILFSKIKLKNDRQGDRKEGNCG